MGEVVAIGGLPVAVADTRVDAGERPGRYFTRFPRSPEIEARRRAGIVAAAALKRSAKAADELKSATEIRRSARAKAASETMADERAASVEGWTHDKRAQFLGAFAEAGNAAASARSVGMTPGGLYHLRTTDPVFAAAWADAKAQYDESIVARALDLAVNGLDETVVMKDGVKTTRRHSDKLLAYVMSKHGGIAPAPAANAVAAARVPGKAGEDARLWLEGEIARIAGEMEAERAVIDVVATTVTVAAADTGTTANTRDGAA